jgi:hypothetical protein
MVSFQKRRFRKESLEVSISLLDGGEGEGEDCGSGRTRRLLKLLLEAAQVIAE